MINFAYVFRLEINFVYVFHLEICQTLSAEI